MEEKLKLVFSLCSLFVGGQKKLKRKISYNGRCLWLVALEAQM